MLVYRRVCCLHPFSNASASQGDWGWVGLRLMWGNLLGKWPGGKCGDIWPWIYRGMGFATGIAFQVPVLQARKSFLSMGCVVLSCLEIMRPPHSQREWLAFFDLNNAVFFLGYEKIVGCEVRHILLFG